MYTSDQIINVLKKVTYPGKGDIVSLGMVEKAEHSQEGIVIVLKTDRQKDPVASSLKHACVKALKEAFGDDIRISSVEIQGPAPRVKTEQLEANLHNYKVSTTYTTYRFPQEVIHPCSSEGNLVEGKETVVVSL